MKRSTKSLTSRRVRRTPPSKSAIAFLLGCTIRTKVATTTYSAGSLKQEVFLQTLKGVGHTMRVCAC